MKYVYKIIINKPGFIFSFFSDPLKTELIRRIKQNNSVSIHIRLGDYLDTSNLSIFSSLDDDYFEKAISIISEKVSNPLFFIFTDEPAKVINRKFMKSANMVVASNIIKNDIDEFLLMSLCKHNICANSTFSYWAASLNTAFDKIVIQPHNWFNDKKMQLQYQNNEDLKVKCSNLIRL
jgi:hypothetical protein